MMKRLPLSIVLVLQLAGSGLAQQPAATPSPSPSSQEKPKPPESDDVVRITTNLVQVDAVITDENGKPVTDLKPDELELFENGRKQKITNLSFYVMPGPTSSDRSAKPSTVDKNVPPVPANKVRPEDVRRTIAIVIDDLGLSFESVYFVRRALKKFVDEQMQTGDLVAILRTTGGMGALQQFTTDKRILLAAIERVRWYASGRGGIGSFEPIGGGLDEPGGPADPSYVPGEDATRFREDVLGVATLDAISYVVRGLRDLPGRKSVLLVSGGFRLLNRDDLGRSSRVLEAMRRLADQANRAAVVINTMDARGLEPLGFTAADNTSGSRFGSQAAQQLSRRQQEFSEAQDGLIALSDRTGGIAFRNNNDLNSGIRRSLEDQKSYYLIGYRPDASTFDERTGRRTFHRLSLKVTRPGKFKIRMRNGFYGVADEEDTQPSTPVQQLIGALKSPFGATGVHVQLTSLFAHDPQQGSLIRSILYINPQDLTFTEAPAGKRQCVLDLVAITFDNGIAIDQVGRTYTILLDDVEFKRVMREGLVYYATVPIKKPGAYQLRISLRDSVSERIGSASQFIEAPDIKKKRLVLSGLIVRGEDAAAFTQAAPTKEEGLEEGDIAASPAIRRLKPGMVGSYGLFVYNARIDKASSRPQVTTQVKLFRDGKQVFAGKETPFDSSGQTDLQRLAVTGAIQLGAAMEPGEYMLQVIVTDLLADKKYRVMSQWMDFQIVK